MSPTDTRAAARYLPNVRLFVVATDFSKTAAHALRYASAVPVMNASVSCSVDA